MAEALVEHAKGVIRDEYLALIQGIMNMHKRIMGGGGGGEGGGGGSMLEL